MAGFFTKRKLQETKDGENDWKDGEKGHYI